ncbi:MSHA biogenesis protein MshQ [Aeromonas veronii]|nr:MSHA biogenesis protein MshQ [Aeromonas veronii]
MRNLWIVAAVWLFSGTAGAFQVIDTATYFPAVTQGHRGDTNVNCNSLGNPALTMYGSAKVNGTAGAALNYCASTQGSGMPLDACDNADGSRRLCTITRNTIRGLSITGGNIFFSSSGSSGNFTQCQAGQQLNVGSATSNQFNSIALNTSCSLSFSSAATEYRIKSLALNNGAKVIFSSGDYWIESLTMNQGTEIQIQGEVRIFVKNALELNDAILNASGEGSLLLFGYGGITLNGGSQINGYVYSDQNLTLNNSAIIRGRTTSRSLNMTDNSVINDQTFTPILGCFSDNFPGTVLSDKWVVKRTSGTFDPKIVSGRLRMTEASGNQATSATYQRLFPAANNLVEVTFRYYAWSPNWWNTGGDGLAVILSDATVTPQPGSFGGALGYAQRDNGTPGFAGGWLGVGLDEYGNFSNGNEGKVGGPGFRAQAIAIRGGVGSSYRYLAGTAANLSPKIDVSGTSSAQPGHLYRLRIDSRVAGRSMVSLDRNTGSGFSTLVAPFDAMATAGQEQVPADFLLSLTGSTGGANNNHELDDIQICALRSNPIGVQIDHFQLDHSGQPLTCNPETVTVKACADAACNTLITDPVTATLSLTPTSASNGWIDGNTVTFSGGSTTVQLRNNTPTAVTIGVSGSTPTTKPFSSTLCKAGAGTPSAAACTLNFADSGFFFDVPDIYSNQPQDVTISAVKKDDITKQCVPGFTGVRSVGFWGTYNNPNTNSFGSKISIDGNTIATYAGSVSSPTPTTLDLTFDNQGKATLKKVTYSDAGQMKLSASHNGSGETAGLVMTGSDTFVARPVGLCITPPQGVCAAGDSSCPVFKKAGETFQVDIKAMAWESANDGDICAGNLTTPNFALTNIALATQLVAPIPGQNAQVGTASYNHSNGMGINNINKVTQSVSEVGVFRMTATPPANGYFNYTIPSVQSQPVGRFVPWDYSLSNGFITPACNAFTYMSQPFASGFVLTARNLQKGTTQNYQGAFAKGVAEMVAANALDGVARDKRITLSPSLSWASGIASVNQQSPFGLNTRFDRAASPEAPFATLSFGIKVDDKDGGNTLLANPNMNTAVAGTCSGSGCNAVLLGTQKLLYGRLQAGTAAGLASAPLAIPLQMQYYEGGNWLQNKEDKCTQLSLANQGFTFLNSSHTFDAATRELNLGAGRKIKLGLGSSAPGGDAALAKEGEILFHFAKPNISVRIPYKVELAKQPSSPLWLSDPTSANDGNLQGEAIFGSSRGNDRIIYRREVLH